MPNYARFGRGQIPLSKTAFFPRETSSRMRRRYLTIKFPDFQAFLSSNSKPATVCAQGRAEVWELLCRRDSDGPRPTPRSGSVRLRHPPCPPCLRLLSLNRLTAGHTETTVVAVAARRPALGLVLPPATAANHAAGASFGADRVGTA